MLNSALFEFLDAISEHNSREYFAKIKPLYTEIYASVTALCQELIDRTGIEHDEGRPLLPKECLFRIYRDARRLKEGDPKYKHHFSFMISPLGKKSMLGGYYVHIERGRSFFGSGIYRASSQQLLSIRNRLKADGDTYLSLSNEPAFVARFGAVEGTSLIRPPRGFTVEDDHLALLKMKQHIVRARYDDELVLSDGFVDAIMKDIALVQPWSDWLNGK